MRSLNIHQYFAFMHFQKIDWKRFLNRIFRTVNLEFTDDSEVVVYAPQFMKDLAAIIEVTPRRYDAIFIRYTQVPSSRIHFQS